MTTYTLAKVEIENVMKCTAFSWTNDGKPVVHLKGDNGAGKSSILKAIQMALGGGALVPDEVQRQGSRSWKSEVVLQTEHGAETLTVVRSGKGNTPGTLTITTQEKTRIASPQALLNTLISNIALDPLLFLQEKDKRKQQEMLMRASGIEFDIDAFNAEVKQHYDQRTLHNRDAKRLHTEASTLMDAATARQLATESPIDVKALLASKDDAIKHNREIEQAEWKLQADEKEMQRQTLEVESLRAQLKQKEEKLAALVKDVAQRQDVMLALVPIETGATTVHLSTAQEHNNKIATAKTAVVKWDEYLATSKRADEETAALSQMEKWKADTLASAKMPVDGLEFGDDLVLFNGAPFEQASTGERLTVAIGIAAAMNPALKVLFVDEGSILDDEHWQLVEKIADDKGLLVWINSVAKGRPGLLIADGQLVEEQS